MKEYDIELTENLRILLKEKGAQLVGIGDMSQVESAKYPVGVSVALAVPIHIIKDLQNAPTKEYYEMYHQFNKRLNEIVSAGADYLISQGYQALAQTTDYVTVSEERISKLPHKTVATRAGLGWIGKNCLLVTPEYGCAIRLSSLLTNAPLCINDPINSSRCGACSICQEICPAQAIKGNLWSAGLERESLFDKEKCFEKQREIMMRETGIDQDLCGKCFAQCVYTQKYINAT